MVHRGRWGRTRRLTGANWLPPSRPGKAAAAVQGFGAKRSGLTSLPDRLAIRWNAKVFVGDEISLEISFAAARERLARLADSGVLVSTSEEAYSRETTSMMRVGAGGLSKLVRVQVRELINTGTSAGLAIRWEATGPGGMLFPVLDADIRLIPAGEHGCLLGVTGSYRPPFGPLGEALDRAILHRVATATIRGFLAQLAAHISGSPGAAKTATPNGAGSAPPRDVAPS